jgi:hypothetical protein
MTPDYCAIAGTYSLYKAYAQTLAVKLTEQCQFHTQDKPNTNVGMSHPTQLFWALFARFNSVYVIAPFFKRLFGFTLTF